MLAASLLMMASTFLWPSASVNWPPRTTVEELNAMVKTGHYHLIREQKIGHQIEAVGIVELVGPRWPLVKLGDNWQAHLFNIPEDHGLKPGDSVKFKAMILDEAYSGLQLWTYTWSKLEPAPAFLGPDRASATTKVTDLAGSWLLTMPAGFEYEASLEQIEKSSKYRLVAGGRQPARRIRAAGGTALDDEAGR